MNRSILSVVLVAATLMVSGSAKAQFTFSPDSLPDGADNIPYSQMIVASGGLAPYDYELADGVLPAGLTLDWDGTLSGTPTESGTFYLTISATDDDILAVTDSIAYTLVIGITHTVTFVAGSGGTITGTLVQTVHNGDDCTAVEAVPNPGYHFVNWTDTGGVVSTDPLLTVTAATADDTITAHFVVGIVHTVTFVAGSGGTISGTLVQTVSEGASCTAVQALADVGCHFVNWTHAGGVVSTDALLTVPAVTADDTITANFEADALTRTVTFVEGPGGTISGALVQVVDDGDNCTAVQAVADPGHHFVNWTDADGVVSTSALLVVATVTADDMITANFEADILTHTVTFVEGAGGAITGTLVQTVIDGNNCTAVQAVADPGYLFVNWTDAGGVVATSALLAVTAVTADDTITANFEVDPNIHMVTFVEGAGGRITGTLVQVVADGNNCTAVRAVADPGYLFVNWTDAGGVVSTSALLAVTAVTANDTITANFEADALTHAIMFVRGPGGTIAGTLLQVVGDGGNCSIVEAMPSTGYHFVNWTDAGGVVSTDASLWMIFVTSNDTITANFALDSLAVTFAAGLHGSASGTLQQIVGYGTGCTPVQAVADANCHFVNWTAAGGYTSTANPLALANVVAAKTYTANFAINTFAVTFAAATGGSVSGQVSQRVGYGASCTGVRAVPVTGYHFVSWTAAGGYRSTANPLTLANVTADMALTANFDDNPVVEVVVEASPGALDPASGTVNVGDDVPFTIGISNSGGDATDVRVTIPLPDHTAFVSGSVVTEAAAGATDVASPTVILEGGNIVIHLPVLPANTTANVQIVLRVIESGPIALVPTVQSTEIPQSAPAGKTIEVTAEPVPPAKVVKSAGCGVGGVGGAPVLLMALGLGLIKARRR